MYAGTFAAVLGLGKVHAAWVADPAYDFTGSYRFAWSLTYVAILCVAAYGVGLPDLVKDRRSAIATSLGATAAAALGISALQIAASSALLPRFVVFGSAVVLVGWYSVCGLLASGGRARAQERDRVVLIGSERDAQTLRADLEIGVERDAQLVAVLTCGDAHPQRPGHKPLVDVVLRERARVVVLAREAQLDESIVDQAAELHEAGLRVRTLSRFYEEWLGKLPIAELERISLMFDVSELHRARYGRVKRLFDVVAAAAGCVALAVVTPFVALGDLVANGGPLFYRQARVGRGGSTFEIIKFRTMRPTDGRLPSEWTSEDDPRITPFGRLLRRTHVDELPQVLNIVRGDLTLVGPRPEQPHYVDELVTKIPFYHLRHLVRPGLTGWAQVKYGYAGNETDALEKLQYEFYYLRHQNLSLDLAIVGRTIRTVIGLRGR
jgi:lipopolysaccharide/colanic/teichoic acid biosynthesis glycosyltransferase